MLIAYSILPQRISLAHNDIPEANIVITKYAKSQFTASLGLNIK